ncbi:uncharacterized protein LOC127723684 [Mytilus californianus]|uniref:uncharacterized protein LOC127723684 n=1 Tax=Mytilus californianus TaxID=6549 RepID=UPI0022477841|nr:uncharacterized protein LOC127723684 [Mytilus californianus]XP_052086385.1 uncharacterized protein LOC127723684 [Mytilus californianus]XP_052086386.1 uncharacterized protein LOC127723684 [Mytilus californianus]
MAYYQIPDPEQLIECPYDKVHMVAAKRMQYHLMKCRRNFTGREFATCPFNARHEMPKPELRYHIANCPDKAMLEPILSYEQSKNQEDGKNFKGCTDLPKYDDQSRPGRSAENWDEEIPDNPRIGVDPSYFARMEYKDMSGMSRSEKKSWRNQCHLPPDQRKYPLQEKQEEEEDGQLRKPRIQASKFMIAQPPPQQSQVLSYSLAMAGIGRGGVAMNQEIPQAAGRAQKMAAVGRGRVESVPAVGRGMATSMPPAGRAMGRASALNYAPTMNGTAQVNGMMSNVPKSKIVPPGFNGQFAASDRDEETQLPGQFADFDDREEDIVKLVGGNKENESPPAPARAPAGIGRGVGLLPPSAFSVGLGRGVLRDMEGAPASPSFVVVKVPSDTGEISRVSPVQEGSINANFEDAKKREIKKIEKKLKQIELLEEKHEEGYSYNKDEELKVRAKDKLLKALEELTL